MKPSANCVKNLPGSNEGEDQEASNQSKWAFTEKDDSSSSVSSVPDNLNLIDGEIEIIQRNKSLTEDDKVLPLTALHKIKVNDKERKLLAKCSSVSTDWALELESSFLKGSQLLVRKISPGSTFSHCYGNQGAFDVVVIRAHLMAKSGKTVYDGYFCRRQKLYGSLERALANKKPGAIPRKSFQKFGDTRAHSTAQVEQLNAGGDFHNNDLFYHHPSSNSGNITAAPQHGTANLSSEGIHGPLPASDVNEPIQMGRGSKKFNESSKVKPPNELRSPAQAPPKTTDQQFSDGDVNKRKHTVELPDPQKVPTAVLDVRGFDDFLANKKVIDYLNRLEEGAEMINNRLVNAEVSEEDIGSLSSSTSAILREYGYNFPETTRVKKHSRRYTRKTSELDIDTTSESDVSDSELKSEVVKRAIEGKDFTKLLGLLKNSKEWKESTKDDWKTGSEMSGKIERRIHKHHS